MIWVAGGMVACTVLSGVILFLYALFTDGFDIDALRHMSPIEYVPLMGTGQFYLIYLPVFFFFNYCGEEVLWRGYILPRQEAAYGRLAWLINAILHCVFHLSFSLTALLFFLPFMLLMPYIAYKRKNTVLSIIVHFLLGAPTQIMAALGLLS